MSVKSNPNKKNSVVAGQMKLLCKVSIFAMLGFFLSSCGQSGSESVDTQGNDPVLADAGSDRLSYSILTGKNSTDTLSYWKCATEDAAGTSNVHVRFWEDGTGFSGDKQTTWEVDSESSISITYDAGTFSLVNTNVATSGSQYLLEANDLDGNLVSCTFTGPRFGVLADGADVAVGSTAAVANYLAPTDGTSWSCEIDSMYYDLTFIDKKRFDKNGIAGKWFVDSRNNLFLNTEDKVEVWADLYPTGNLDDADAEFNANWNDMDVRCNIIK